MTARSVAPVAERNWDSLQFRLIFAISFVFYLGASIVARFTPRFWRAAVHRSIFREAVEAAGTTAQIAFAG